ncbi:MAG: spore germination protein [Clostridia bacterium]|nr:spore germination protein [Clostridia bacterium]
MNKRLVEEIIKQLSTSPDAVKKVIDCHGATLTFLFLKSMTDENLIVSGILKPIMDYNTKPNREDVKNKNVTLNFIKDQLLITASIENLKNKEEIIQTFFRNKLIIFSNLENSALAVDIEKYPIRVPTEPPTSPVVKGPREGFVEDIKTNLTLLRRRFSSKNFAFLELSVGKFTKTRVAIAYLDGIASKSIICSIKNKISKINIDGIVDSYYLINFLEEKKHSMFKQVGSSEKPDIVAAKMLEGRVAIVVDNSPIVLTVPFLYVEDVQSSNDYYTNYIYATFIRFVRLFGIFMSVIVPGFYLALRFYHYNIVPYKFLITIANATQTIPFTPLLEIIFILVLFQLLYEVSLRLPRYLGLATSIVGALILGDTGVKAGLISPPGVMIIALSMIAIYTVPDQADQLNLLRFVFLILGGGLGFFGIIAGSIFIISYLNSLENYSSPYFAPYTPYIKPDLKDAMFKNAILDMKTRPYSIKTKNRVRLK